MMKKRLLWGIWIFCLVLAFSGCSSESQITKIDDKYKKVTQKDAGVSQSEESSENETTDVVQTAEPKEKAVQAERSKGVQTDKKKKSANENSLTDHSKKKKNTADTDKKEKTTKKRKESSAVSKKSKTSVKQKTSKKNAQTKKDTSQKTDIQKNEADSSQTNQETANPTEKPAEKTCTISIDCKTILSNKDQLKLSKKDFVPQDGVILKSTTVELKSKDTVYDILYRVCKSKKIQLDASYTPAYKTYYVRGIHQIYEMDCGNLSGWMYLVNGISPNYGCSQYPVQDGDVINWQFSCDGGKDIK